MARRAAVLLGVAQLAAGAAVSGDGRRATVLAARGGASQRGNANCVSVSSSANDFWCATNCGSGGHCPAAVCKCEKGQSNANVTDAEMDYLRSSSPDTYSSAVNCMSMADVAQVLIYVTQREQLPIFNKVYAEYFQAPYPNRAAMIVAGLAREEMLCEVVAYAALPEKA